MSALRQGFQGLTLASTQGGSTFIKVSNFCMGWGEWVTTQNRTYKIQEKLSAQVGYMLQHNHVVVLTGMAIDWTNWLQTRPGDDICPSFDAGRYEIIKFDGEPCAMIYDKYVLELMKAEVHAVFSQSDWQNKEATKAKLWWRRIMGANFKLRAPPRELTVREVWVWAYHCTPDQWTNGTINTMCISSNYRATLAKRAMGMALKKSHHSLAAGSMAIMIGNWNTRADAQQEQLEQVMKEVANDGLQVIGELLTGRGATGRDHAVLWYPRLGVTVSRDDSIDEAEVKKLFYDTFPVPIYEHAPVFVQAAVPAPSRDPTREETRPTTPRI